MSALSDEQLMDIASKHGIALAAMLRDDVLVGDFQQQLLNICRAVAEAAIAADRAAGAEPVGEAGSMPGTSGFSMAVFKASDVPVGTNLYTHPQPVVPDDIAKDAERYRWLRDNWTTMRARSWADQLELLPGEEKWADFGGDVIDAAIDKHLHAPREVK